MNRWLKTMGVAAAATAMGLSMASCSKKPAGNETAAAPAAAPADKEYTIGWTIYAGWMPWPYAEQAGKIGRAHV